jgi:hypothetical protein
MNWNTIIIILAAVTIAITGGLIPSIATFLLVCAVVNLYKNHEDNQHN